MSQPNQGHPEGVANVPGEDLRLRSGYHVPRHHAGRVLRFWRAAVDLLDDSDHHDNRTCDDEHLPIVHHHDRRISIHDLECAVGWTDDRARSRAQRDELGPP